MHDPERTFRMASEAAVLLPSAAGERGSFSNLPEGSVILCPLDEQGAMCSRKGRIVFAFRRASINFTEMLGSTADGVTTPGRGVVISTCRPADIRIAAIYDLDRKVISRMTLPGPLEDWAEEDREDLLPSPVESGCTVTSAHVRLADMGSVSLGTDPVIAQFRNGQIMVGHRDGQQARVYDHDDPDLLHWLEPLDLPPQTRIRLLGRSRASG